jgi:hypothetical protein
MPASPLLQAGPSQYVFARLSEEFDGRVDPEIIRRVSDEEVAFFEGTRVKDFVPILAWRRAKARLGDQVAYGGALHARGHASSQRHERLVDLTAQEPNAAR